MDIWMDSVLQACFMLYYVRLAKLPIGLFVILFDAFYLI